MACEDFPCCGHEQGDCPDSSGRMKCVECVTPNKQSIKPNNQGKSISKQCDWCTDGYYYSREFGRVLCLHCNGTGRLIDLDHDYSMNY